MLSELASECSAGNIQIPTSPYWKHHMYFLALEYTFLQRTHSCACAISVICACSAFVTMYFCNNYILKLAYATAIEHNKCRYSSFDRKC